MPMVTEITMIDLGVLAEHGKVRNLAGKERGVAARETLRLDQLDAADAIVDVIVPEYLDTISPSYFQGLFSESIEKLHGRSGFLEKYRFKASDQMMRWVEVGIRNATSSRANLI